MNSRHYKLHNCHGFTLLEALIGFLILSIGMLGIASLQAISLKAGKTSVYSSVAIMKVDELLESMRANPAALSTYSGAGASSACTGTKICTPVELALDDVFFWRQNLMVGLPSTTTAVVTVTAAVPPSMMASVKVEVKWKERDKEAGGSIDKTYTATTNICTVIPC
ncbi:MAG: type IV pilus modification protein PilV [Gammaproteobacteria bacterium]|nr:type IV pilus modification protein PilV [Gammaproteobacteria bacterium]